MLACVSIVLDVPFGRPLHIVTFKIQWLQALVINDFFGDNIDRRLIASFAGGIYYMPLSRIYSNTKKICCGFFFFLDCKCSIKPKHPTDIIFLLGKMKVSSKERSLGSGNLKKELSWHIICVVLKNINMLQECS